MTVPPDKSGAKNPIQEIKSAITYAKACTFDSVCGTASTDANVDDDGNSAYQMSDLAERLEWIENCHTADELDKIFKAAYANASSFKDTEAQKRLVAAKDAKKKALRGGR